MLSQILLHLSNCRISKSIWIALCSLSIIISLSNGDLEFLSDVVLEKEESPLSFVGKLIEQSEVIVFSKSYCPYCARTKALFKQLTEESSPEFVADVTVNVFELDLAEQGSAVQNALLERTGQRTVPNVFVAGQHVGGNDDTHALAASGKLKEMLEGIVSSKEL